MVNVTVHGYSEEYINVPFEVFYDGTVHEFVGLICFAAPGERYSGTSSFLNTDGGAVRFVDGKPVRSGDITFSGWVDARLRPTRSYFAIDSDPDDPLTFILTVGGYRYLYGSGTLRTPGGRLYVFRPVDTTDNAPND